MPSTGRVVRLHFQCHAELPIGSTLRVTGSSLWAPTSVGTPSDPMSAHHIAQERQAEAFPALGGDDKELDYWYQHPTHLYASSVEMVTTPETYPLWKTKQPVIVVLNHTSSAIQHHYYRYLVVTPGASAFPINNSASQSNFEEVNMDIATSPPAHGTNSSPIMMWEQPFGEGISGPTPSAASFGTRSMAPDDTNDTLLHLAQLPYRTLDINVETAEVVSPRAEDRTDTWNSSEDPSFQAYQI